MTAVKERPKLSDIHQGDSLPTIVKQITQQKINLYAEASGDYNPIHIDEAFAAKTPLGGTIAHGMLILAYASEMMTRAFAQDWLEGGKLSIRFKAAARPQDTITTSGKIDSIEDKDGIPYVNCSLECRNQNGDVVITGGAVVRLQ
jgi:3-hydroxybutyryl-CoA dehydratase